MRGLVVAGVAGAAWLFWSASAHAAPAEQRAANDPVGGVTALLSGESTGFDLAALEEAADPAASVGTVVPPGATVPLATVVAAARPVLDEVTDPVTRSAEPVFTSVRTPVLAPAAAARPVTRLVGTAAGASWGGRTSKAARTGTAGASRSIVDAAGATAGPGVAGWVAGAPGSSATAAVPAAERQAAGANRRAAKIRFTASPVGDRAGPTGAPRAPGQPLPAPVPAYPGSVSGAIGASTGTPGSTSDGGATAVLTNRFAAGAVARPRPVPAGDVAGRPLTVQVPTVSPD